MVDNIHELMKIIMVIRAVSLKSCIWTLAHISQSAIGCSRVSFVPGRAELGHISVIHLCQ